MKNLHDIYICTYTSHSLTLSTKKMRTQYKKTLFEIHVILDYKINSLYNHSHYHVQNKNILIAYLQNNKHKSGVVSIN